MFQSFIKLWSHRGWLADKQTTHLGDPPRERERVEAVGCLFPMRGINWVRWGSPLGPNHSYSSTHCHSSFDITTKRFLRAMWSQCSTEHEWISSAEGGCVAPTWLHYHCTFLCALMAPKQTTGTQSTKRPMFLGPSTSNLWTCSYYFASLSPTNCVFKRPVSA